MKKPKQLGFFKRDQRFFGGRLLHGRKRRSRPLSVKDPIHLVLRSSWATGSNSFLKAHNQNAIRKILVDCARKYGVKVYRQALASNHLHLILRIHSRRLYRTFIRVLSSKIASHVMRGNSFKEFKKSLRGDPPNPLEVQGKGQAFWQFRPFTRLLHWGRDFKICGEYLKQNVLEALGFVPYRKRNHRYSQWLNDTFPYPDSAKT